MMSSPATIRSLRTELLLRLTLLLATALLLVAGTLSLAGHHRMSADPLVILLVVAAILVLFVTIAAIVVNRSIIRPLRTLTAVADQIANGDLQQTLPSASTRELNDVAASFARMTERLREDQTQLIRAEKLASIGRLAASVAHEIGNPLGAIIGHVHLLRARLQEIGDRLDVRDALAALERESARIDRIVRGLLDYARARPADASPIDIDEVIRSTIDLLRTQGALANVEVALELTNEPLLVCGQRHDLEQLFVNLFINAVDAMTGRGRLIVRLERAARFTLRRTAIRRTEARSNTAVEHPPSARAQLWLASHDAAEIAKIVVADSGPGIAPELAERIFDPFFTTKAAGKGTGLGLAIVSRIVENFHGTIWVTSAREGGAAFHVLFPVVGSLPTAAKKNTSRRLTPTRARARL